jgi:hypothetical protein
MSLEIFKIVKEGRYYRFENLVGCGLPNFRMETPDALVDQLAILFERAHGSKDGSWLSQTDKIVVQAPDNGTITEIVYTPNTLEAA